MSDHAPEPQEQSPADIEAAFDDAANQILGRQPGPDAPPQGVHETPQQQGGVPEGGVIDQAGRLRDAETGSFTTAEALLEKYGMSSLDEFAARYEENNSKVGSMANEVGQSRQLLMQAAQQMQQLQAQQQAQQQGFVDDEQLSQWDEYTVENPMQAAQAALQTGNPMIYERVMDTWYTEDPKMASRFENSLALVRYQQQQQQQMAPLLQPLHEQHLQNTMGLAVMATRQKYPDFDTVIGNDQALSVASQLLGGKEFVNQIAQIPTVEGKQAAFDVLYHVARSVSNNLNQQTPGPGSDPTGVAGRIQATLASPTSMPTNQAPTSAQEALANMWEQGLASLQG